VKALTIRQPRAELILQGRKQIELREWATGHRGLLVIHAGGNVEEDACRACSLDPATITRGAVVGVVEVVEMIAFSPQSWRDLRPLHLAPGADPGRWTGWRLANPRRLPEPIPMSGTRGLYDLPEAIAAAVRRQLGL